MNKKIGFILTLLLVFSVSTFASGKKESSTTPSPQTTSKQTSSPKVYPQVPVEMGLNLATSTVVSNVASKVCLSATAGQIAGIAYTGTNMVVGYTTGSSIEKHAMNKAVETYNSTKDGIDYAKAQAAKIATSSSPSIPLSLKARWYFY